MQKLKVVENTYLSENVLRVLSHNRIITIIDFLQEDTEKLVTLTKLTLPQIIAVRDDIFMKHSCPVISGTYLLSSNVLCASLSTGIHSLDVAMGEGIPIGISEVCGLTDSGKSQLCFQLAINFARRGQDTVLYIDTKGDFSAVRVQKILEACGCSHKEMAFIMFKIKVVHIFTMEELLDLFKQLKDKSCVFENLRLVLIDSLPSLMLQFLGDDNKVGLSFLNTFVNITRFLCKESNLAVVCVNIQTRWVDQDIPDLNDDDDTTIHSTTKDTYNEKRNRCLGKYWQHIPTVLILLEKSQVKEKNSSLLNVNITKYCDPRWNKKCTVRISNLGVT